MYNKIMYKTLTFDLGRNALKYLVKKFQIEELFIPYYLCDVVRHAIFEEGCKPIFYHINDNFYPTRKFPKGSYILYPNYFGICRENVNKLVQEYPNLITDNAHAYFEEPTGFASFNAGHKFGYKNSLLWIKSNSAQNLEIPYDDTKKELYKLGFQALHKKYSSENILSGCISSDAISFVYPYLAKTEKDADKLVEKLKEEGKTVYRYWNPIPPSFAEYKFYSRLVPIPVLPE